MENQAKEIEAQACSKVLVTGAYLVLDPKYQGVVIATNGMFRSNTKLFKR